MATKQDSAALDTALIIQVSRAKSLVCNILSLLHVYPCVDVSECASGSLLGRKCELSSLLLAGPFIINFKAQLKIYSLS